MVVVGLALTLSVALRWLIEPVVDAAERLRPRVVCELILASPVDFVCSAELRGGVKE